ncbi:MAG: transglycosylase SLT domain-containing protein [Deltaproteobacteria bacterium]|nr:transglycosylase SLT domain-containing protein [Deltaproteobacteria bacterium]
MSKKRKKNSKSRAVKNRPAIAPTEYHPWRLCPAGRHWVREHPFRVPASKKNPDGITSRRGHCADNPSHRDHLYKHEMQEIAQQYFHNLSSQPKHDNLGCKNGNDYDDLIAGWTQYWNETLKPDIPLDPDLVKALIRSESSFNPKAKNRAGKHDFARGLMQVTDRTRKILADEKGELGDRLITLTDKDAYDPNLNIAAGIRWLFHKRQLASTKLKRQATWEEAVENYKAYLDKRLRGQPYNKKQMEKFREYYRRLKS